MNQDTKRGVQQILEHGFYRQGITLGAGGWNKIPRTWNKYTLFIDGQEIEYIRAEGEVVAIAAFKSLFNLDTVSWDIVKTTSQYNVIASNYQEEPMVQ